MRCLLLLCIGLYSTVSAADLVRNGAFASGLAGWDLYGAAARVLFTAVKVDGASALRYAKSSNHAADNYHLDQTIATQPDTTYRVSVRYRSAVLSPVFAVATINWEQFTTAVLPPSATWRDQTFTFYSGTETQVKLQLFAGAQGRSREAFDGESFFTGIRCEAGETRIVIDAAAGTHVIPAAFTGVNTLFWLETPEDLADGTIASRISEARFGLLRYPAGTAGQNYDWRRNTVVNPLKYPGPAKPGESYLDTDGFIALARRVNAAPFIVLNLASIFHFTDAPSEADYGAMYESAALWAAHFKRAGVRVACYELGNEHYLRDEGSGYVMMTARQYATLAKGMIAAIRTADPEAVFGAVGPRTFSAVGALDTARGSTEQWWPTVLAAVGEEIDRIILHHYWAGTDNQAQVQDYGSEVELFRRSLAAWQRTIGRERALSIGYTEWGGKGYSDAASYALFIHESLSSFAAHRTDFAIAWPHRRMSAAGEWAQSQILDGVAPRAAHGVFAAWGDFMNGGTFVPFSAESTLPSYLFGAAARKHEAFTVLIGNKSAEDRSVPLHVRGPYTRATYGVLGAGQAATIDFRNDLTLPVKAKSIVALHLTAPLAAPVMIRQPVAQAVTAGQTVRFLAAATSSLPLSYQWKRNGADVPGATAAELTIPVADFGHAGSYGVVATTTAGSAASSAATLAVLPFARSRIANLSLLAKLAADASSVTVGTIVGGGGTSGLKPILIRAAGPSLAALGVSGALADPRLEVFSGQSVVVANDNWGGTAELSAAFASVGAFPYAAAFSRDAAVHHPGFPAGSYTVRVEGNGSASGEVIAELYDSTPPSLLALQTPRLINVSVLQRIGPGEMLTAGFVIAGETQRQVLIRAIGPTLATAPFHVGGAMTDPKMVLYSGQREIASSDDWGGADPLVAASAAVGAFALGSPSSKDAMMLTPLRPGSYTAQVSGVAGATGLVLLEVYEVP